MMVDCSFEKWLRGAHEQPFVAQWADKLIDLGATWETFRRSEDDVIVDDLVKVGGIPILAARYVVGIAKDAIARRKAPAALFWDLDKLPIPLSSQGAREITARFKSIMAKHGCLTQFRGYTSRTDQSNTSQQICQDLQFSGCQIVHCPSKKTEMMIAVDAMRFAFLNPEGATLGFVTDGDEYDYLLTTLDQPAWPTSQPSVRGKALFLWDFGGRRQYSGVSKVGVTKQKGFGQGFSDDMDASFSSPDKMMNHVSDNVICISTTETESTAASDDYETCHEKTGSIVDTDSASEGDDKPVEDTPCAGGYSTLDPCAGVYEALHSHTPTPDIQFETNDEEAQQASDAPQFETEDDEQQDSAPAAEVEEEETEALEEEKQAPAPDARVVAEDKEEKKALQEDKQTLAPDAQVETEDNEEKKALQEDKQTLAPDAQVETEDNEEKKSLQEDKQAPAPDAQVQTEDKEAQQATSQDIERETIQEEAPTEDIADSTHDNEEPSADDVNAETGEDLKQTQAATVWNKFPEKSKGDMEQDKNMENWVTVAPPFFADQDVKYLVKLVKENGGAKKSYLGIMLRTRYPERFSNRDAVRSCFANAIESRAVVETGEGAFKQLYLPSSLGASVSEYEPRPKDGDAVKDLTTKQPIVEATPSNWASTAVTGDRLNKKAVDRVVSLLTMMAENDDISVLMMVLKKQIWNRYGRECPTMEDAELWLQQALTSGRVVPFKKSIKGLWLSLPENAHYSREHFPPDDMDTVKEEDHVMGILWNADSWVSRKDINESLKKAFPKTMNTPFRRTKVFINGHRKGKIFFSKGPYGQVVGLSENDSRISLNQMEEDMKAKLRDEAMVIEHAPDEEAQPKQEKAKKEAAPIMLREEDFPSLQAAHKLP
ncbi:expressed unknown protein [Seminavis robusta]|uniref:NYN domain-containing protein n=1 Tax=Seminavis robusta TaxID=568900 RepID=A0A9N8DNV2_9STRA|nr:expressed unknown protein [Seminavis robusta]|eukprot:Sro249_g098810.1 n/a (884) ;mRNA; f:63458-66109